jgi:malonyl-ACP decarboxylase
VASGQVDACVALGALMDLSYWECRGLRALGAMGSTMFAERPQAACRPFDRAHDGFIYGECSAAIVLESATSVASRGRRPYARMAGWGMAMDANRNPDPSREGEVRAMRDALDRAGWQAADVDYVNPHGTGSIVGDETEVAALKEVGLGAARINATKSLTGHGLTAAGAVEVVATLLQMRAQRLHPTRNLDDPIDSTLHWVGADAVDASMNRALSLSMGFGGINTALCWEAAV